MNYDEVRFVDGYDRPNEVRLNRHETCKEKKYCASKVTDVVSANEPPMAKLEIKNLGNE